MPRFRIAYREGDGVDPRYDKKERGTPQNRKALQLCAQVQQVLMMVLPGSGDDILSDLTIESVTLAPDSSQMLVRLKGPVDVNDALQSLAIVKGKLRTEIAASIHRKNTPKLLFEVFRTEDQ